MLQQWRLPVLVTATKYELSASARSAGEREEQLFALEIPPARHHLDQTESLPGLPEADPDHPPSSSPARAQPKKKASQSGYITDGFSLCGHAETIVSSRVQPKNSRTPYSCATCTAGSGNELETSCRAPPPPAVETTALLLHVYSNVRHAAVTDSGLENPTTTAAAIILSSPRSNNPYCKHRKKRRSPSPNTGHFSVG